MKEGRGGGGGEKEREREGRKKEGKRCWGREEKGARKERGVTRIALWEREEGAQLQRMIYGREEGWGITRYIGHYISAQ